MLSMISIPVTALALGLPAQRAIAQRFSGVLGMLSSLEGRPTPAEGVNTNCSPCLLRSNQGR